MACDVVREVLANAQANLYSELSQSLSNQQQIAERSNLEGLQHSEDAMKQLLVEERKRQATAVDDLRADLAGRLVLSDTALSDPDRLLTQSELRRELVEATEALQAVGLEMCEAQGKSRQQQASTVECMSHEIAEVQLSQQELARQIHGALAEGHAKHAAWFGELQQELQNFQGVPPGSGAQCMDVDVISSEQGGVPEVAEQLRECAELRRGLGEPREAAIAVPPGTPLRGGVHIAAPMPPSNLFNLAGSMPACGSAMLMPSPGSPPPGTIPVLVLPPHTAASPSAAGAAGGSQAGSLRQPSPSSSLGGLHGSVRQPSPSTLAGLNGRHSSPAVPTMPLGAMAATGLVSRAGGGGMAASGSGVIAGPGRRTKSQTPLCAWNGVMQGAPPRTPREPAAWA